MDRPVVYADLNLSRVSGPQTPSPPFLPKDVCQGPPWHGFALKLSCAGIIFLLLSVIGLSVSVIHLTRNSPKENGSVDVPENRSMTTERPDLSECPTHWLPIRDKCLYFSLTSEVWDESKADCNRKESSLLHIQDQEELKLIQNLINETGIYYWVGLKLAYPEKKWKWINGSPLDPNILQIYGEKKENSCAHISKTSMHSEECTAESKWICEKKPRPARNKMGPDS